MDSVGVKVRNAEGRVCGERRWLASLSSGARSRLPVKTVTRRHQVMINSSI